MDPKAVVGSPITSDAVVGRTTQIHTADPTAFDDADDGYVIGSRWVNTTLDRTFTCADNTVGSAVWVREDGGSAGVTDHGALTGLGDDDHTQYHTDARGDARYAPVAHVGAGGTAHANVVAGGAAGFMSGADKTKLDGIAAGAEVNVNADWNAASGDAQIINKPSSFTPSLHASTHVAAGSDPLTLSQSQITNLTTDLAAKAPLASPALTGTPTAPTALQGTNTTQIATTAFVNSEIAADAAPLSHVGTGGAAHAVATTSVAGFMSGADKTKLDGIAAGAEVNVNADWNAASGDAQILNKPSSFTPATHASTHLPGGSDALTTATAGASAPGDTAAVGTAASFARSDHRHSREAFGTAAGTVCQGNDARLSDARTPLSHTHGNITNAGAIGATASLPVITGASGVLTTGTFGTAANTFCQGNDARLSDARTPIAHASNHSSVGPDPLKLDDLATPDDNTDLNATTTRHGLLPKLGGGTSDFLRADGTWAAPPGSGGSSVWWAQIATGTAISITAAATATIERMHEVSLTSADATVTLPTAVGNSGKCIGIKVLSTNTKSVTIDGNSTETIDGSTTLNMHKDGTLLIRSDGANWCSLVRELAPGLHVEATSNAGQVVTLGTTALQYEDEVVDTHGAWSGTVFTCPASGVYAVMANATATAATEYGVLVRKNGTGVYQGQNRVALATRVAVVATSLDLSAGDTVDVILAGSGSVTRTTEAPPNRITITRIGD